MSTLNRIANCKNHYQGRYKRVLCVCSAGLLRSPTAAVVLSQPPFNYNTRAAGLVPEFALIPVDPVLLEWADEIVCMEPQQQGRLKEMLNKRQLSTPVVCLDIDDQYPYRDEILVTEIREKYLAQQGQTLTVGSGKDNSISEEDGEEE